MKSYLNIVDRILADGEELTNRTGTNAIALNGVLFEHDMRSGFPLLTTKKMNLSTVLVELEAFIKGITSKRWMQERKCFIWDEWCSPTEFYKYYWEMGPRHVLNDVKSRNEANPSLSPKVNKLIEQLENKTDLSIDDVRKLVQLYEPNLGPVYGFQWRNFGANQGSDSGIDQLDNLIHTMKTNPTDRRMIVSAWNPTEVAHNTLALPACHWAFEVHSNGKYFDLIWHQRSVDVGAGLPFNIASYAFLMLLLERETRLTPRYLKGMLGNTHIYVDHIEQLKIQKNRELKSLPQVSVKKDGFNSIFDWKYTDFLIENYDPHPFLKLPIAV
jgi:thymidylate synthase